MTPSNPVEPPIDAMRRLETHIGSLDRQPAARSADGARLAPGLRETLPETGQAYSDPLDTLFGSLIPASVNCSGPGYLAYIPGGGIFHAAVGPHQQHGKPLRGCLGGGSRTGAIGEQRCPVVVRDCRLP